MFFGKGTIVHTDSKCTFEGEFLDHHKHGDAKFILQSGYKFTGRFNFGSLQESTANYGRRF
jgi:hypothetical protein